MRKKPTSVYLDLRVPKRKAIRRQHCSTLHTFMQYSSTCFCMTRSNLSSHSHLQALRPPQWNLENHLRLHYRSDILLLSGMKHRRPSCMMQSTGVEPRDPLYRHSHRLPTTKMTLSEC